jgi:hypothetical protein
MSNKFDLSVVAEAIPFADNTYTSKNLRDAVVEAGLKPSTGFSIPEVTSDPPGAIAGDAWVVKPTQVIGAPIGMLLSLTYAQSGTYKLSYKTASGLVVRTDLT